MKIYLFYTTLFLSGLLFSQETDELIFSPLGGIYEKGVQVSLESNLPNARIYYTLDGSTPSSASLRYTKPIQVNTIAVIRAVVYGADKNSAVITNSYFCDRVYSLPIISIATDPGNLWDYASGIYVKGCCADTIEPYMGANFWRQWERKANVEMYEPDGKLAFNQVAGFGIFGGFSRALPQKSLYVVARTKYGKNAFEYPIFPARDHKKYKSFILRNAGGDFVKTHFRDAFMTQLAKPTGIAIQEYRPAIVFLNGEYWGIQNMREKINEHYLKDNFGIDKDNVDLIEHQREVKRGDSKAYKRMLNFIATKDMTDDNVINELRSYMNIDDYLTYNIAEVYSDNRDAGGNIRYWKERNDSSQWRWILYDTEMGLGNNAPNGYKNNTLKKFTSINNELWPDPPWSTFIIRSLLENKNLRYDYINRFADHLNTVYHPDTAVRLINKLADGIREEMPFHQKRWGTTMKAWDINVNSLIVFAERRPYYLRQFIMEKFELDDTAFVEIDFPGSKYGDITLNSLTIERDFKGVYFQDIPIKVKAEPKHDYEFIGWKNREEKSNELSIILTEDVKLTPLFKAKQKSIYADSIIFNEVCFYQHESDTSGDWVEIYNHSSTDIDLGGWVFTERSYAKGFVVPNGTVLPKKSFVIIAENQLCLSLQKVSVVGDMNFGLSKNGEQIKLYDNYGFLVDSLSYSPYDKKTHPDSTFSISLVHPDSLRYSKTAWVTENCNPGFTSETYSAFLKDEEDKAYWTKVFFVGGGGFFFILVGGLLSFRYFKKKKGL